MNRGLVFLDQAGGFDRLLLDSLYEDEAARRQIQQQNAGYGFGMRMHNPIDLRDPFLMSNGIAPPPTVQIATMTQQQQQLQQQQQQQQQQQLMMAPYHLPQYPQAQQPMQHMGSSNPFGDPFLSYPQSATQQGNHSLL